MIETSGATPKAGDTGRAQELRERWGEISK